MSDHLKVVFSGFCDRLKIHFIISRPSVQPGWVIILVLIKLKSKLRFLA